MKVLDLGSGIFPYQSDKQTQEEIWSIDIRPETDPTVVHDLSEFPYPFDDNSFDKIYCSHVLEHLQNVIAFMEECFRLLKPEGRLIIKVPHYSGRSAWCDPTHIRTFGAYWTTYFCEGNHDQYGNCQFELISLRLNWTRTCFDKGFVVSRFINPLLSYLANRNTLFCERIWCYWVGGFSEIESVLKTNKN
jgi:SAM-dependent methyltransferase